MIIDVTVHMNVTVTTVNISLFYTFDDVTIQGSYRLKIIRLRSSFNAIRIDNPEFPEINYEVLLGRCLAYIDIHTYIYIYIWTFTHI